jgi:hypothetical protein
MPMGFPLQFPKETLLRLQRLEALGTVLTVFLKENALIIFGLSSKIFCELLPLFPGEGY